MLKPAIEYHVIYTHISPVLKYSVAGSFMHKERATILVVDDIAENIDVLRYVLKEQYRIKVATTGEKAIELACSAQAPDLILLDVMMPGIDGYEVCRRLKADEIAARIPIIFVTAMNDTDHEVKGLEMGAVDYLTKPINPSVVRARVGTHIALYRQSRILENILNQCKQELTAIREFVGSDEASI